MSEQVSWQYHIEYIDYIAGEAIHLSDERLSNLGADDWELVTIWEGAAYFKRRVREGKSHRCPDCGCNSEEQCTK
jgi:hypothetical protein